MTQKSWHQVGILALFGLAAGFFLPFSVSVAGLFAGIIGRSAFFVIPMAFVGTLLAKGLQKVTEDGDEKSITKATLGFAAGGFLVAFFARGPTQVPMLAWVGGGLLGGLGLAWGFASTARAAGWMTGLSGLGSGLALAFGAAPGFSCPT
ncbi:MAG: hypothetical protein KDB53_20400 [Planctomycetes bacterium]|nr:hypothetical protein [Planctomycetota bacterium]